MSCSTAVPALPPDVWAQIARAALAAEGYSAVVWARLSLVARAWRDGLKGMGVNVIFSESVSAQQSEWLSTTTVSIDSIILSKEELASEFLAQGGPPLPEGLTAICVESGDTIDLEKITCGDGRLSAAAGLTLVVTAGSIQCKQEGIYTGPYAADDPIGPPVSMLPAGFTALEMHASDVSIHYKRAGTSFEANPLTAAYLVCVWFSAAPASYRQFSLCWQDKEPLHIRFTDMMDTWTCKNSDYKPRIIDFDAVEALAEHMRSFVGHLNICVTVFKKAGTNRVDVVRL